MNTDISPGQGLVPKLWTKDFSIITFGTVVSMLGNAVSGFAIGLLVLDQTDSVFLYAFFMVCYCLPKIVMPLVAGPLLDRFSRKKMIYSLDFCSSLIYLAVFLLLRADFFVYPVFVATAMLIGSIDSIYTVAYDSFYPTLIAKGNFTRAYSVASLIYPLATTIMVPIAAACYKTVGLAPLFLFNAVTFFVAAVAETRITAPEAHLASAEHAAFTRGRFVEDFRAGLAYLKKEKGLMAVTRYFFISMFSYGVSDTLLLPYFKSIDALDRYAVVMAASTIGRLVGGLLQYRFRYPPKKKLIGGSVTALLFLLCLCQCARLSDAYEWDYERHEWESDVMKRVHFELVSEFDVSDKPVLFRYSPFNKSIVDLPPMHPATKVDRSNRLYEYLYGRLPFLEKSLPLVEYPKSLLQWSVMAFYPNQEIYRFLQYLGYEDLIRPTAEQYDHWKPIADDMPCYPRDGYIRDIGDCIIVRLG